MHVLIAIGIFVGINVGTLVFWWVVALSVAAIRMAR